MVVVGCFRAGCGKSSLFHGDAGVNAYSTTNHQQFTSQ